MELGQIFVQVFAANIPFKEKNFILSMAWYFSNNYWYFILD
jgi:hypothetical protein